MPFEGGGEVVALYFLCPKEHGFVCYSCGDNRLFGAFLEFAPGKEGMVHISKIAKERINRVEDVLTLGDKVTVKCMGKDKMGRMSFSIKDVSESEK